MSQDNKESTEKKTKTLLIKRLMTYWLLPVWITLALVLTLFLLALTTSHFDWSMSASFLKALLPVFIIILLLIYVFWYLTPRWPSETALIMLLVLGGIFIFASLNNIELALEVRTYISENYEINYFATGMTIFGVLIAIWAIYQQQRKQK